MAIKYPTRNWALVSVGAEAGKSTFVAANARTPAYVIDSDNRFDGVQGLADGEVLYPATPQGKIVPLDISEQAEDAIFNRGVQSVVVDSVTKIYSLHARRGFMRNRSGRGNKNKASEMISKSDAMTVLRDIAAYGTDLYYIWHETAGVDASGQSEVRAMISQVEMDRLFTSINAILRFKRENGRYAITVERVRDFGGRPANARFTIWDSPGNYWQGGAARLERLMYTSFSGQKEAIRWMGEQLGNEDPAEMENLYEHIKSERAPESPSQMWVAVVEETDRLLAETEGA